MWYSDGDGEFATPISNSLPQVSRYIEHLFAYINMPILIIDLSKKTFVLKKLRLYIYAYLR